MLNEINNIISNLSNNKDLLNILIQSGLNKIYNESDDSMIFKLHKTVISNNKLKGLVYKVNDKYDVYVLTANRNGEVKENKIIEYTVHFNLKGFKFNLKEEYKDIYLSKADFEFIVSNDHSLLVYNIADKKIIKMKPEHIILNKKNYGLVALKNHFKENSLPEISEKLVYIPINYLEYKRVKDMTMYDISVEDTEFDNFFLSNGVCVVDTVVVYALHSEEAKKEAIEKMAPSKQYVDPFKSEQFIFDVDKNIVFGLVYGTKDAKELGLSYKPKLFRLKEDVKDYNELLAKLKNTGFSIYDYIQTKDGKKYTIGQYLVELAINKVE